MRRFPLRSWGGRWGSEAAAPRWRRLRPDHRRLLVQHVSWESIFLLNLPLGAVALAVTVSVVAESRDLRSGRGFDLPGVAALAGGLFCIIWALIETDGHVWVSAYTLSFLAAGLLLLVGFAVRESFAANPLLPLNLVASTEAIVGNAPIDAGGVAGGLQTTANQLGGVLGTSILGSVLATSVGSSLLPALARRGITGATARKLLAAKQAIAQGQAPVTPSMPPALRARTVAASHEASCPACTPR